MHEDLRQKLIHSGRILAREGQGDYFMGHVTARLPDNSSLMLMKPHWIGLEEMTVENIITVNLDGEKVAGEMDRHSEVYIHSEIMRARPDINAVVHTHAPNAVVFSSLGKAVQSIGHDGIHFTGDDLPVFSETAGLIETLQLGKSVARTLSDKNALLLRNHGIVTAGKTIEEAIFLALHLETACKMQLMVEACGGAVALPAEDDTAQKKKRLNNVKAHVATFNYLSRRCTCGCN